MPTEAAAGGRSPAPRANRHRNLARNVSHRRSCFACPADGWSYTDADRWDPEPRSMVRSPPHGRRGTAVGSRRPLVDSAVGAFVSNFLQFLFMALWALVFGRMIMSWVDPQGRNRISGFLFQATEPILAPVRRVLAAIRCRRLVGLRRPHRSWLAVARLLRS